MKFRLLILLAVFPWPITVFAQQAQNINGKVLDANNAQPLIGAVVRVLETDSVYITPADGTFRFAELPGGMTLVASYVGYKSDTVRLSFGDAGKFVTIRLQSSIELAEAQVEGRRQTTEISTLQTRGIETLNEGELLKAACCNLSESFETNPSVDVNYTDALTGAREIQLLGLSGIYTQMLGEAIPTLRGMAAPFGLLFIPGPWMESIQISKGAGSVANGYEAMTGQINIEYKKPLLKQPLMHINLYGDAFGRGEINTIYTMPLKRSWNYMAMVHASGMQTKWDDNNDGFMDMPAYSQLNVYNRFHFNKNNKWEGQLGVKALVEERQGGQVQFDPEIDKGRNTFYGIGITTRRIEAYAKTGLLFPEAPFKSAGIQVSATLHDQQSYFGLNNYDGTQGSLYANLLYMSIITYTDHKFKTGVDFKYDHWDETVNDSGFSREEIVPGAYFEYNYGCESNPFGAIAGVRFDYHNLFGVLFTPRLHLKYNFTDELILRASAGRGYRYPNTYADNIGLFTSSKRLVVLEEQRLEDAWNGGLNFTSRFLIRGREGSVMLDAFRTLFNNQWLSDQFSSPDSIFYYNLKGRSSANSFQLTVTFEPLLGFVLKSAWRMDDVKTDYLAFEGLAKPLLARQKLLFNAAYTSRSEAWRADATLQWEGPKNLPVEAGSQSSEIDRSPDFYTVMAQVTRVFRIWEVYVGAENLLGFTQRNVILGSEQPFAEGFDANRIWGPVMGRRIYAGIRLNISAPEKNKSNPTN
jgi:outer membrane cobalamin receptor